MSMSAQETNAFDNWFEEHEIDLMQTYLIANNLISSLVSYLDEMPRLSPLDYDDQDTMRRYIDAKHSVGFNSYCLDQWAGTRC